MATVAKERTTSPADARAAALARRNEARHAYYEAARRAGAAVKLVVFSGDDRLEELRAREETVTLERAELEARAAMEEAEREYLRVAADTAAEKAPHYREPIVAKARELSDALGVVARITTELEALGGDAKRECSIAGSWPGVCAYDRELVSVDAQVRAMLPAWRHRVRDWLT